MNAVYISTVEHLKCLIKLDPQPYKVVWIDETTILVTQKCIVSFRCGTYGDTILCDVIPMQVSLILFVDFGYMIEMWEREQYYFSMTKTVILCQPKTKMILKILRSGRLQSLLVAKLKRNNSFFC